MRVLVTGASGFIGRHLVRRLLKEKYKLFVENRANYQRELKRIEHLILE